MRMILLESFLPRSVILLMKHLRLITLIAESLRALVAISVAMTQLASARVDLQTRSRFFVFRKEMKVASTNALDISSSSFSNRSLRLLHCLHQPH